MHRTHKYFSEDMLLSWAVFVAVCSYRLMLDWVYFMVLSVEDHKYTANRTIESFIVSWVLLVVSFLIARRILITKSERSSALIISAVYFVSFVPFTTCVYAGCFDDYLVIYNSVYWLVLLAAERESLRRECHAFPKLTLGSFKFDDRLVKMLGMYTMASVIYISWKYTGFRLHFDLFDVYGIRLEARGYNYSRLLSFTLQMSRLIHPILAAYYIVHKRYRLALAFFLIQILSFGIEAHKSEFFTSLLAVVLVFVHGRLTARQFRISVMSGIVFVTLVSVLELKYTSSHVIITLIIRRIMFVPNILHKYYFDFFINRNHELVYLRAGIIYFFGKFLGMNNPYAKPGTQVPFQIGAAYESNWAAHANNGLASEALTNFGAVGAVVIPILLIFITLRLFDMGTKGLSKGLAGIAAVASMGVALTLLSTDIVANTNILAITFVLSIMNRLEDTESNSLERRLTK